ncbi:MAG: Ger(x)C family spore germination C-terminal domain-containing protein [Clostridia bacterium]|nr:Ger(x)C family spore germination C-terminal domain-containing protein [Clostridia bacterium]
MKKKILQLILLLIFSVLVLSGCYDYQEPNNIAYVIALGIDKGSNEGIYKFSIQYARPNEITGGASESGGEGKNTSGILSIESPSIYSAINLANHVISKTFTLSHTKIIVVSEEIAQEGIAPILDSLGRNNDIRPTVYFCIANKSAENYLKSVKPSIEINPAKYYDLIFQNNSSSYTPFNDAQKIYFNYKNDLRENVIPYVGTLKKADKQSEENSQNSQNNQSQDGGKGEDNQGETNNSSQNNSDSNTQQQSEIQKNIPINEKGFEYNIKKYISGNMDIDKSDESEEVGGAVFKDDKMIDTIPDIECKLYNIINGTFKTGYTVIYFKESPSSPVTVLMVQKKKPNVKVNIESDLPKIDIKLYLEGDFISTPSQYMIEKNIDIFEEEAKKYIEDAVYSFLYKTTKTYNSDIFGFGRYAKRSFLTYDKMQAYSWNEKYRDTKFNVDVKFNIKRTGLIIRTK